MSDQSQPKLSNTTTDGRSRHSSTYIRRSFDGRPTQIVGENNTAEPPVLHIDIKPASHSPIEHSKIQRDQMTNLVEPKKPTQTLSLSGIQAKPSHDDSQSANTAWRNINPVQSRQKRSLVLKRSNFGPKIIRKTHARVRRGSRSRRHTFRLGFTALLIMIGAGVITNAIRITYISRDQAAVLAKTTENSNSNNQLDETEPESVNSSSYSVAPDLPKYLRIPKLKVEARVQRLSAKTNSDLSAPTNIFDIGWYENSVKPGEDGAVLLDGQVTGPTKHGVFYSLGDLHAGDKIEIERGDGQLFHYTVVRSQVYDADKVDMNATLRSAIPDRPGLNLISYSNRFDVRANKFESRLVIFAIQE